MTRGSIKGDEEQEARGCEETRRITQTVRETQYKITFDPIIHTEATQGLNAFSSNNPTVQAQAQFKHKLFKM